MRQAVTARRDGRCTCLPSASPLWQGGISVDPSNSWRCSHGPRFVRPLLSQHSVLRHRDFRRFFIGQSASMLGDQFAEIAIPLTAVLVLGSGPRELGFLVAAGLVPSLLLSLPVGSAVDGLGHRRMWMIVADCVRAVAVVSLPAAYLFSALSLTQLYAVALVVGVFDVVFFVAYQPLLVTMVRGQDLLAANSLLNGSRAVSQVAGLSLGGALVAILTAPMALVVNALSFVVSGVQLARIRPSEPPPGRRGAAPLRGGLAWIGQDVVVRWMLVSSAAVNLFALMGTAVLVLYITRTLALGSAALGLVLGVGALGGVLGAVTFGRLVGRFGLGRSAVLAPLILALGLLIYPTATGGPIVAALLMVLGAVVSTVGIVWADIALGSVLAQEVPDAMRARVAGAYRTVNYGVRPLGAVLGGLIGTAVDLRATLLISGLGALAGAALRLRRPIARLVLEE